MSGLRADRLERLRAAILARIDARELPGAVILCERAGDIFVEALGNLAFDTDAPMERDTPFRIASMTKPVTAVAGMILVEECRLQLDNSLETILPEMANRKVLRSIDAEPDDTVPSRRPITLRDLLTFRLGFGAILAPPDTYPIQRAIEEAEVAPDFQRLKWTGDEWISALGSLPLIHQPGEHFLYHTGSDLMGLVIERVTGQSLSTFLEERIFGPLGMRNTGFSVPASLAHRLPTSYTRDPVSGSFAVTDDRQHSQWIAPPLFEQGGNGLVSTIDDYALFLRMLKNDGIAGKDRILARSTISAMTTPQLTPVQTAAQPFIFGDALNWGFGMAVTTHRSNIFETPGRFGWDGLFGTTSRVDPAEGLIAIMMSQRALESVTPQGIFADFWQGLYQALDD